VRADGPTLGTNSVDTGCQQVGSLVVCLLLRLQFGNQQLQPSLEYRSLLDHFLTYMLENVRAAGNL